MQTQIGECIFDQELFLLWLKFIKKTVPVLHWFHKIPLMMKQI